ncbi:HEAT repeat domain-containing protein [uncultured Treponema sp.]|uniref:HEAT repeat domain-containing protein n=1 Tax=uncultured Treponema sp. TaxID=162155 RepID=UPI002598558D|nr:HEAT repeat domain-containing protein [uncultured Treponema sp.]
MKKILFFLVMMHLSFCFSQSADSVDMDDFLNSLNPTVETPAEKSSLEKTAETTEDASSSSETVSAAEDLSSGSEEPSYDTGAFPASESSSSVTGSFAASNASSEAAADESGSAVSEHFYSPEENSAVTDVSVSALRDETAEDVSQAAEEQPESEEIDYLNMEIIIPEKKRPKKPDAEKIKEAERKDEDGEEYAKNQKTIKFGTASEISGVIDKINEAEDLRYYDDFYDLFQITKSNEIKGRILDYFAKQEDDCLEDYAVEILADPYDVPVSAVEKCFNYVSAVGSKAAGPALVKILEAGEEKYFNGALSALGKTGGVQEAKYLAHYLERDDLTVPQRQALMRTLGAMSAAETWEEVRRIALDEDENSFVRMYAAESIGKMQKKESVPVLIKLFEEGDPNMRQYCIKGLSYYPDSKDAKDTVMQAIRDDHYKVRLEAISAVKKLKMEEAVPYLTYRAKNDPENVVKKECFPVLAELNTKDSISFLIEQITDKSVPDSVKYQAAEALMKNGISGEDEIIALAKDVLKDDRRKSLRQNLGKLFIKYARPGYAEICVLYLQSKDTLTQSQGLELYKNARYEYAKPSVQAIVDDKNAKTSNKKRARSLLGLSEEEETKSAASETASGADAK